MKTTRRSGKSAFTLIELMAVITIIVILAALIVGAYDFVKERQSKEKAKVQIALLSKALEDYKLDMGTYPATTDSADGNGNSGILFNALYFAPYTNGTKIYLADLDPATTKQGWTSGAAASATKIVDPWGNEYHFRSTTPMTGTTPNSKIQNPDFDLWSLGKDGVQSMDANGYADPKTSVAGKLVNADNIQNF